MKTNTMGLLILVHNERVLVPIVHDLPALPRQQCLDPVLLDYNNTYAWKSRFSLCN